jgi:hypothetical protein
MQMSSPGAFQRGEAQLRQSLRQLWDKALLLGLDAPTVIAAPEMGVKLAVADLDFSLLKALAETVAACPEMYSFSVYSSFGVSSPVTWHSATPQSLPFRTSAVKSQDLTFCSTLSSSP